MNIYRFRYTVGEKKNQEWHSVKADRYVDVVEKIEDFLTRNPTYKFVAGSLVSYESHAYPNANFMARTPGVPRLKVRPSTAIPREFANEELAGN